MATLCDYCQQVQLLNPTGEANSQVVTLDSNSAQEKQSGHEPNNVGIMMAAVC